ncbi:MAG: two pore domain potassium channel family protein [Verrucomicrobiaceae bacterium]|nr:MAG: two pore domain potassium channel family protein [Verrucomicrobiaceae bacterium]
MLGELLASFILLGLCVVIHSAGIALILRQIHRRPPVPTDHPWKVAMVIVQVAWKLTSLHLFQIVLWAVYFRVQGCLPDFETALYFSGTTYSTLGYGDVVLPQGWRTLGPAESLTGILMCGFSTGLFFAIFHRVLQSRVERH